MSNPAWHHYDLATHPRASTGIDQCGVVMKNFVVTPKSVKKDLFLHSLVTLSVKFCKIAARLFGNPGTKNFHHHTNIYKVTICVLCIYYYYTVHTIVICHTHSAPQSTTTPPPTPTKKNPTKFWAGVWQTTSAYQKQKLQFLMRLFCTKTKHNICLELMAAKLSQTKSRGRRLLVEIPYLKVITRRVPKDFLIRW